MNQNAQWMDFLWGLVIRSPVLLVTVLGVAWALINWRKSSTAATLITMSCTLMLFGSCIFPSLFTWLTPWIREHGPPGGEFERMVLTNRAISVTWNLCTAFCLAAMIFAAFAGRAAATARYRNLPEESPSRPPESETDRPVDDRIQPG